MKASAREEQSGREMIPPCCFNGSVKATTATRRTRGWRNQALSQVMA